MLCPEVVGRDRERELLRARVDDLAARRGGLIVLLGEAGAGKSRLAREALDAATERGMPVLTGRAVPGASPLPHRPLTEAFLSAFRSSGPPDDAALDGFRSHLGRLIPAWSEHAAAAEDSPLLLGEAIVRLLAAHADDAGAVLLVEDLHWADPETLAVLDYLADALREEPVLCLCTARPDGASDDLVRRVERRAPGAVLRVAPLAEPDVERMVSACLGVESAPPRVRELVQAHSDGSPFLVEELLAGLVASGELRFEDDHWTVTGDLTPTVPASLRESIDRRLEALSPTARRVLGAAALLGRSFDWELLPGIAEVDGRAVVDALRSAVDEQLVQVDGDSFRFRHALTRETVLNGLLPPERRDVATRAWPAHELANPGLPGATLELAADLAEAAGDRVAAARHLVESARRALVAGAFVTAESTARRAARLAATDCAASFDAEEVLTHVLVAAGKPGEAIEAGRALADRLEAAGAPATRRADLLIAMARAALAGGDSAGAAREAAAARAAAAPEAVLAARLDALDAAVALEQDDLAAAELLARLAADGARATHQPEVECNALLVLGAVERTLNGMDAADATYQRAAEVAAGAGLAQLHLQVQQERALVVWTRGDLQPLHDVRALAVSHGALISVAVMDLTLADTSLSSWDRELCLTAASACAGASRRYRLATESVANLWLAGAHALGGDHEAMQHAIDAALEPDPHDPRILGDLYGRVLATSAFVDDELDRLPELLDTMIEHVRIAPPTKSVYPGRILWALVHTIDDLDLGAVVRSEFAEVASRIGLVLYEGCGDLIEAVALGRQGEAAAAVERFEPSYERLIARPLGTGSVHALCVLTARAALRDGWGDPERWLRNAEAFFESGGYHLLARRCRTMLAEAGAVVPRRGRGDSEVPPSLRALGVTSREVDVLKLVIDGRSNKEVAAALFLSQKTVERHLSSLFARMDVTNRHDLADRGRTHLGAVGH